MSEKEIKKLLLRIPPDLWEAIQRMADAEFRSINGQIEYLLRDAVRRRGGKLPPAGENTSVTEG